MKKNRYYIGIIVLLLVISFTGASCAGEKNGVIAQSSLITEGFLPPFPDLYWGMYPASLSEKTKDNLLFDGMSADVDFETEDQFDLGLTGVRIKVTDGSLWKDVKARSVRLIRSKAGEYNDVPFVYQSAHISDLPEKIQQRIRKMTGSKERLEAFLSKPLVAVYYFDQETVFYDGWYMALYQIATDNTRYKRLFRDLEQADGEMALKRKSIYALESTEKDGLSFSAIANEKITLQIKNGGESVIEYGDSFRLEKEENGSFYGLNQRPGTVFFLPACVIQPGDSVSEEADVEMYYGPLTAGRYRIVKPFRIEGKTYFFAAEFTKQ
ncbi:MAG: hypothetical protein IJM76_01420 [Lachnospiraceae bacterium]|nr:hypothetical protein [Lachnospiraceae bacterium]